VNKRLKDQKSEKGMTSEELAKVRSGVTSSTLGLSLLNNFRIVMKRREQDEVERKRGGMGIRKEVETRHERQEAIACLLFPSYSTLAPISCFAMDHVS
jgi:hypothetical protein